jgi:N-acetylglucosaminyldiphosphoundecaprenol N-acetyl-beta-D-mannosaminyltransferase
MEFMFEICALAARRGLTVGLYGAEPSVSDAVRRRLLESHPGLKVVYCCSPPFGQLTGTEDKAVMEGLSDAAVQMLFVSLGCPKPYQLSTTHVRSGASRYGNPNFAFAASRVTLRS